MATTPPASRPRTDIAPLSGSARLAWLESALNGQPDANSVMLRARQLEASLTTALERLRDLYGPAREACAAELVSLRRELEALIAASCPAGSTAPPASHPGAGPPRVLRERLAMLLGVPMTPPYDGVLDAKLAEHSEQLRAFHHVATQFGFMRTSGLGQNEARGALVLTANASILQLSAPGAGSREGARRYVYQGIYGAAVPSEGTLMLTEPLRPGQPLRAIGFSTSPICDVRAPTTAAPWARERVLSSTLERVFGEVARRTAWGAQPAWVPSVVVPPETPQPQGLTARGQLREALRRLVAFGARPDPLVEVEVLGLCIYLQQVVVEGGAARAELGGVKSFAGSAGEQCQISERRGRRVIAIERPGEARLQLLDVSIANQHIVVGAPLAILDGRGSITVVIGEVSGVERS